MLAWENFGRTSAPRLPQAEQTKPWLNIRQLDVIGPADAGDLDVVAAFVVTAIHQETSRTLEARISPKV
jgi:hypothetical protein